MSELNMDSLSLESYLEQGGKFTSPENAFPRYRAEIMRLMASFIDSELAGAAGFADCINTGPGIKERLAASRITLEKLDHAERVLMLMGQFGANTERYFSHHPWTDRLPRDADIGNNRHGQDMRLNVFHYPLEGWTDAVVMNVLMGQAVSLQLEEYRLVSYEPLAEVFREVLPREHRHAELGLEGLRGILEGNSAKADVEKSLNYWYPRVAASFGSASSSRFDLLKRFGLRRTTNEQLRQSWEQQIATLLTELSLSP